MAKPSVGEMLHTLFGPPPEKSRLPPAPANVAPQAPVQQPDSRMKQDLPVLLAAQAQKIYNPGMPPVPIGTGAPTAQGPGGQLPGPPGHNQSPGQQGASVQTKVKPPTNSMLKQGTTPSLGMNENWGNADRLGSAGT